MTEVKSLREQASTTFEIFLGFDKVLDNKKEYYNVQFNKIKKQRWVRLEVAEKEVEVWRGKYLKEAAQHEQDNEAAEKEIKGLRDRMMDVFLANANAGGELLITFEELLKIVFEGELNKK